MEIHDNIQSDNKCRYLISVFTKQSYRSSTQLNKLTVPQAYTTIRYLSYISHFNQDKLRFAPKMTSTSLGNERTT